MTIPVTAVLLIALASQEEFYPVTEPPASLKVSDFYKKYTHANGYPIVASGTVDDYALKEAGYLIDLMLARRPDVRKAMIESGSRMIIYAYNEFSTDLPEYSHFTPRAFYDRRARGFGGSRTDPVCSTGEENLLAYAGDPYEQESILIHEFAHNIHLRGMVRVDETFDGRVKKAYDDAMARGLWKTKYAATNHHEYFAEGVQSWFDNNRKPDHDHNHVDTREELIEYDPGLAELCREVFGDTKLKYTKPQTRLHGHLAGYDPSKAPRFRWPEELARFRPNRKKIDHEERKIEGWTVLVDKALLEGRAREMGDRALAGAEACLKRIAEALPEDRLKRLRSVRIFLDLNHDLDRVQYHPSAEWLKGKGYDPEMAGAVHVPRAGYFIYELRRNERFNPLLSGLAYAWHDGQLGTDADRIAKAHRRLRKAGKLDKVKHAYGNVIAHHGRRGGAAFFAEMTEAYLGDNDMAPFNRAELETFDPELHRLLGGIWGR